MRETKRSISLFLVIIFLVTVPGTAFTEDFWICPECGSENNGRFCGSCGAARTEPKTGSGISGNGEYRRESIIGMERSPKWFCLSCGAVIDSGFCTLCGRQRDSGLEGSFVSFGAYEQDGVESITEADPISWIVLESRGDTALVVSVCALDSVPFDACGTTGEWKNCTLRKWLNEEFLKAAFTEDEQNHICSTRITTGDDKTADRIFILSTGEAETYFGSDDARKCLPTEQAEMNGAFADPVTRCSRWWLRSPGGTDISAAFVDVEGCVDRCGENVPGADRTVRPALWVRLPGI